jgi:hypothetical protein
MLLKAKKPDVYRDNARVEHTGKVEHQHAGRIDLTQLSVDELRVLERLAQRSNGHANGLAR